MEVVLKTHMHVPVFLEIVVTILYKETCKHESDLQRLLVVLLERFWDDSWDISQWPIYFYIVPSTPYLGACLPDNHMSVNYLFMLFPYGYFHLSWSYTYLLGSMCCHFIYTFLYHMMHACQTSACLEYPHEYMVKLSGTVSWNIKIRFLSTPK